MLLWRSFSKKLPHVQFLKVKLMFCRLGPGSCISHIPRAESFNFVGGKGPAEEAKEGLCLFTGKLKKKRLTAPINFKGIFWNCCWKVTLISTLFEVPLLVWIYLARKVSVILVFFDTRVDIWVFMKFIPTKSTTHTTCSKRLFHLFTCVKLQYTVGPIIIINHIILHISMWFWIFYLFQSGFFSILFNSASFFFICNLLI